MVSPGCIPLHPLVFTLGQFPQPRTEQWDLSSAWEVSSLAAAQRAVISRKLLQSYLIYSVLLDPVTASKPLGIVCMEKMRLFYNILYSVCAFDFSML